jgi:hypothetical protein
MSSPFLLLAFVIFVLPPLLAFSLSFLFFLIREFLIEPLITSLMWRQVTPQADWNTTYGFVESRVIVKPRRWYYLGKGGDGRNLWLKGNEPYLEIPTCHAHIEIIYLVDAKSHVIRPSFSFLDEFLSVSRNKAEEMVAKYPDGKQVTVRYDPVKPQSAAIQ